MKRPLGIILSAIVLGLAALLLLLMAALMVVVTFVVGRQPSPAAALPHFANYLFIMVGVVYTGLAAWAILTVMGILRLRSWARYSILIIGGGLAAIGVFSIFGIILSRGALSAQAANMPPESKPHLMFIFVFMAVLYALVAAIGIWWLTYFNLRTTRELFRNLSPDGIDRTPTGAPIAIKILGYLILFGALCCLIVAFLPVPAFLFGFILPVKATHFFCVAFAIVWGLAGYGLLQLKESARRLTIAVLGLGCFHALLAFLPWYQEQLRQYATHLASLTPVMPGQPATINYTYTGSIIITYGLFGLILNLFALWLLHRHRTAFVPPKTTLEPA